MHVRDISPGNTDLGTRRSKATISLKYPKAKLLCLYRKVVPINLRQPVSQMPQLSDNGKQLGLGTFCSRYHAKAKIPADTYGRGIVGQNIVSEEPMSNLANLGKCQA